MSGSFNFIEAPDRPSAVMAWFRSLPKPPEEMVTESGVVLYFRHMGPLDVRIDQIGRVDGSRSPVVNLVLPATRRSILWSTGAVHFLTMPVGRFPEIGKIRRSFASWISQFPVAYSPKRDAQNDYIYYLEGGSCEAGLVYGLPSGMAALSAGQYFVGARDGDTRLDTVCRTLRLRGVECGAN